MKKVIKLLLMTVPIICFALAIYLLTDLAYNRLLESNSVFNLLINSSDSIKRENDRLINNEIDEDFITSETESEVTTEIATEVSTELATEVVTEVSTEAEPEAKPQPKPEPKPQPKPQPKPEETKPQAKPQPKPEPKPEPKPQPKTVQIDSQPVPEEITYSDEYFPVVIDYDSQWALLSFDSWKRKDIPVFFGDSDEILSQGAGQWSGSYFCGLGKNCVLSAHVMSYFYELQDTEIGDEVIMQTVYGAYKYEVTDKFIFEETNTSVLWDDYGGDTLFLYTCYPRSLKRTLQRTGVVCTLKGGVIYKNKYE